MRKIRLYIGDQLADLPEGVNVIYGNSYFDVIDLDFSSLLKNKKIFKALKKLYLSLLMKSGKLLIILIEKVACI